MRGYILPTAAVLLPTAACSSEKPQPVPAFTSSRAPATSSRSTAPAHSAPRVAKAKAHAATPHLTCSAPPERDVDVWMKVPGLPDGVQVLGNWDYELCEDTFQSLQHTSPTRPGYCTEAAWASDNPGCNADASPAARLKKCRS
ncbi:hypothetical protein ACQ4WX_01155 [Streptomyces lasalocidi]